MSLTFVTGALVKTGAGLANLLSGRHASWDWLWQFALWLSFLGGSVVGALTLLHFPPAALPLAIGLSLALAALAGWVRGLR